MKKNIVLMLLTALTFTVGSCSSDSDDSIPESVDERLKPGNDDRCVQTAGISQQELFFCHMAPPQN